MAWIAYAAAWLTFAVVWAFAGAASAGASPLATLPFALVAMGFAAAMGVGVWRLTGRLPLDGRSTRFHVTHAGALAAYCLVYATSWAWIELATGGVAATLQALRASPVLLWNVLMGSWLYLMVAGGAYAVRAERRVRAQEVAATEARLQAQQAQLAALRAQINPHFLFNALHSVGALVTIDPARADRALERLGDLLRYALDAAEQVPLADEWQFTADYLAFEELRLGDRLRVARHADDPALEVSVPPLLLQPLVENAIRYGVADRPDGGRIEIRARLEGRRLRISVADDGRGAADSSGSGLGLASLRQRLQAMYGEDATLRLQRRDPGFLVELDLPADRTGTWGSAA
ncbi:MAG: histidine kinase [Acidobacteriota bacterium]